MRGPFRELPLGSILIIAFLAVLGLLFLIWGIVLVVNPQTRTEGLAVLILIGPDILAICFFWTGGRSWD